MIIIIIIFEVLNNFCVPTSIPAAYRRSARCHRAHRTGIFRYFSQKSLFIIKSDNGDEGKR